MEKKNIVIIVVLSIVTAGTLLALIPVFMYGFSVDVLYVNSSFGILTPFSSASADSYDTMQFDGFTAPSVNVEHIKVGPYKYLFDGGEPKSQGSTFFQVLSQYIDVIIFINITTPNDQLYKLEYTLEDLVNILMQDITLLLGPDEIEIVNGTYLISVGLELTVSIPTYPPDGYEETFYFEFLDIPVEIIIE